LKTDHLRCSPKFHGRPRYDCILVKGAPENFFARILMIFTLEINGNRLCFAYIQPFDPIYQHMNRLISDTELELLRFREQSSKNATFISIHSIIRGAVLIPSGESGTHRTADYLLFDLLDCDMFLRGREMIERYSFLLSYQIMV
jgi:hypothetical protein